MHIQSASNAAMACARTPHTPLESSLTPLCVMEGHSDRVWHVAIHPVRNLVATCSSDKTVRLWAPRGRATDRACEWVCTGLIEDFSTRTLRCSAWSPNGQFLAVASFDSTVSVWALASPPGQSAVLEHVATLEGHDNEVKGVAWSPTGSLLATCSRDKSVWLWEYDERDAEFECAAVLHGHAGDVKAVKWHPARELLLSASYDDTVRAWGETEGDAEWICTETLEGHTSTVWSLAFSPDGAHLATVSDDCSMIVWDASVPGPGDRGANDAGVIDALRWRRAAVVKNAHSRTIFCVDWSPALPTAAAAAAAESAPVRPPPSAMLIATCGADDAIHLFTRAPSPSPLVCNNMSEGGEGANGVSSSSSSTTTATTSDSSDALHEHGDGCNGLHADGGAHISSGIAAGGDAATSASYVYVGGVEGAHSSDINCVLWHPRDPGLLFSAGDDCCIRVWRHAWVQPQPQQ